MKAFISQPMKGKTYEQIENERKAIIKKLDAMGYETIDTILTQEPPETVNKALYYLGKSIEFLAEADLVVFFPGWENARGCKIEHDAAVAYNKERLYLVAKED